MMWVDLSPKQEEKMMHRHAYSLSLSPTKQKIKTDSIDNRARKPQRLQARQRKNIRGKKNDHRSMFHTTRRDIDHKSFRHQKHRQHKQSLCHHWVIHICFTLRIIPLRTHTHTTEQRREKHARSLSREKKMDR